MQMPGWKGHFDLSKTKQEFWKLDEHSGVSELFLYVAVMAFLGALLLSNKEEPPPPPPVLLPMENLAPKKHFQIQ